MKMKRYKCCGWWFQPKDGRQAYCDNECKKEGYRSTWRNSKRRALAEKKKMPAVKYNPAALPKPYIKYTKPSEMRFLPPNKEIVNCVQ